MLRADIGGASYSIYMSKNARRSRRQHPMGTSVVAGIISRRSRFVSPFHDGRIEPQIESAGNPHTAIRSARVRAAVLSAAVKRDGKIQPAVFMTLSRVRAVDTKCRMRGLFISR